MHEDSRHGFVQRLVLRKTLAQPRPKSRERTEDTIPVCVALRFQHAQDVLTLENPAERQRVILRELVPHQSKVFSSHLIALFDFDRLDAGNTRQ